MAEIISRIDFRRSKTKEVETKAVAANEASLVRVGVDSSLIAASGFEPEARSPAAITEGEVGSFPVTVEDEAVPVMVEEEETVPFPVADAKGVFSVAMWK